MDEEEAPQVMIHVRFHPNGSVLEIGERPKGKNPQEWFDVLSEKVGSKTYQAFSGGRGVFRMTREQCDALRAEVEAAWAAAAAASGEAATAAEPAVSRPERWVMDGQQPG
jgi:hypothetical protein